MKIGLITTLGTNIGDDLVRQGIRLVLKKVYDGRRLEFVPVNKHRPLTAFPRWHPIRMAGLTRHMPRGRSIARRLIERVASGLGHSVFDGCDLIVQCGAPVLWTGCHKCEWAEPLWRGVVGRLSSRVPALNMAAGSCYPWEQQPAFVADPQDADYLRRLLQYCSLTTARDALAQRLYASLGANVPLIPCSAFLSAGDRRGPMGSEGLVLINYMQGGGHYEWEQCIESQTWKETVRSLIQRLRSRHRLAFLCHDRTEYESCREIDPSLERIRPRRAGEYFDLVSSAKGALCNRLHASVALASLGIPSVAVGTDTRLLMVKALGLPHFYVKDVDCDVLEHELEGVLQRRFLEQDRLLSLRAEAWTRYLESLEGVVCS